MSSQDFGNLALVLRMIDHLHRRLSKLSLAAFLTDVDEIDLTAYRLAVIGEVCAKLSEDLKAGHPHIKWVAVYAMRNIIVHDYSAVEPERLWTAYANDVDVLAEVCRVELGSGICLP